MFKFIILSVGPGVPGPPKLQMISHIKFNVSWTPPKVTNGKLIEYVLEYNIFNATHWLKEQTSGSTTYKILENLKNNEKYKFRVRAATSAGEGKFSTTTVFVISATGKFKVTLTYTTNDLNFFIILDTFRQCLCYIQ